MTVRETSCGLPTVRNVEPATDPEVAVIVVVPNAALVARPWLPALLLIIATVVELELQLDVEVRSCVEPSLKVPVAVNC